MRLKLGARKSDLARIQAYAVGDSIQKAYPEISIDYFFKESLGDKNLHDPLWKMPERGVFTEDFNQDLKDGVVDMVVHSWKDLPTENRPGSAIVATHPRADSRDLLLFKNSSIAKKPQKLKIFSSSPRRAHNIKPFFADYLPWKTTEIEFESVRGNIPTRLKKYLDSSMGGIIVAKAAIDRILSAQRPEFLEAQKVIQLALNQSQFMVLPLELNPPAAAQGALAIEALDSRDDLKEILNSINCVRTMREVETERSILKEYGGGCHLKIGISVRELTHGKLTIAKGMAPDGTEFHRIEWRPNFEVHPVDAKYIWPEDTETNLFKRIPIEIKKAPENNLWVAKSEALPESWYLNPSQLVWTSGLSTWKKLAQRGVWVNGSAESLGEEIPDFSLFGRNQSTWTKLTHAEGAITSAVDIIPTYKLEALGERPNWDQKTHFFWMSASSYFEALRLDPSISARNHYCGMGNTYSLLKDKIPQLKVFLSYKEWKNAYTRK